MKLFNRRKKFKPSNQGLTDMAQITQNLERAKAKMPKEIVAAHGHSAGNKSELNKSKLCGCFCCLKVFPVSEINEWVDEDKTAVCPKCGIDSVLGDAAGFELSPVFLKDMHEHWF